MGMVVVVYDGAPLFLTNFVGRIWCQTKAAPGL